MADILVIEDYPAHRDLLTRWLIHWGHTVTAAADGMEGLAYAATGQFDLILVDIHMQGLDGLEVTRRLRAQPATGYLRVLALTADMGSGIREQCLAAGCDEYESKPIDFARLRTKIQCLCAGAPTALGA